MPGGHERSGPDAVDVDPAAAQEADADDLVDEQRDRAHHREHRGGVHGREAERVERERADVGEVVVGRCRRRPAAASARRRGRSTSGTTTRPAPTGSAGRRPSAGASGGRAASRSPKPISTSAPAMPTARCPTAEPVSSIASTVTATDASWPIAIGSSDLQQRSARALLQADRDREQPAHRRVEAVQRAQAGERGQGRPVHDAERHRARRPAALASAAGRALALTGSSTSPRRSRRPAAAPGAGAGRRGR